MTVANLGIQVQADGVQPTTVKLKDLAAAAAQAEGASDKLARSSATTSGAMQKMLGVLTSIERDLTVLTHHSLEAGRGFEVLGGSAARASTLMNNALLQRRNLMFQMVDIGQGIPLLFQSPTFGLLNLGNQMAQIGQSYFGAGGMGAALKDMGGMLRGLATRLGPVAAIVGALTAGFAAMTHEINRTAETQVSLGDVLTATWQLAAESIMDFMKPAIEWLAGIWDYISPGINLAMNALIGSFDIAFRNIKTIWNGLPSALGDFTIQTSNTVIEGIEGMINEAIKLLNGFIRDANGMLEPLNMSLGKGLDPVDFKGFDNPFAGANDALNQALAKNAADVRAKTLAGGYTTDIGSRAQALAQAAANAGDAEKSVRGLADRGFGKLIEQTNAFGEAAKSAFNNLGSGIIDAFRQGGNVAMNILGMIGDRILQLGENVLNSGLNSLFQMGINSLFPGVGGTWNIPKSFVPGGFFPGFANGGDFTVGGTGGTDSQMVRFMATPGERVSVRTPSQAANSNSSNDNRPINLVVNVNGANGNEEIRAMATQGALTVLDQYRRSMLQDDIMKTTRDQYARGNLDSIMNARYGAHPRMKRT